jgi:hypothetical protein
MLGFVSKARLLGPVVAAASVAAIMACKRQEPAHPGANRACALLLPEEAPPLEPPPDLSLPESQISVGIELGIQRLQRELSRQVPAMLARESRRDIGSAGEVSYVVRRGGFDVKLDGERLLVSTPVSAEVEVCKPLGPFCPTYGRCSPRLLSTASIPIVLGKNYDIGASRVSVAIAKPCVIAGLDVSPEIRKQASQQAGSVERRINGSLPQLRPAVDAGWRQLFVPVALGARTCLRITPQRLVQGRPALQNGTLSTKLAVTGALRVEQPCDQSAIAVPTPLPELETEASPPGDVSLAVPISIGWTDVGEELTRSLAKQGSDSPLRITHASARPTTLDGRGVLALDLTLEGTTCGQVRVLADPRWDATTSRLRLDHVRIAPGQPKRTELLAASGIERLVAERAAIALPVDVSGTPTALRALVERLAQERPEGVEVAASVEPARIERVAVAAEGLVPIASFRGTAAVRVR